MRKTLRMLSEAETVELRQLGERFYSSDSDRHLSEEELARLRHLESQKVRPREVISEPPPESSNENGVALDAPLHRARPRWRGTLVAVTALVLGIVLGWLASNLVVGDHPEEAGRIPPELLRPATDEDFVNIDTDTAMVDPTTARFIASLDGMDIYLATDTEQSLMCILAARDGTVESAGCSGLDGGGAMASGVSESLTIVVGDPQSLGIPGAVVQLSETVAAIRRG